MQKKKTAIREYTSKGDAGRREASKQKKYIYKRITIEYMGGKKLKLEG